MILVKRQRDGEVLFRILVYVMWMWMWKRVKNKYA